VFSYIKGTVSGITHEFAVIEAGGIGYKVNMPFSEISRLPVGESAKVFTYMYIREGILDLYGFISEDSLNTFELLLSISGVGPKAAIAVLSVLTPPELALALANGDFNAIKKAPGIGEKIAKRIILELKGKLDIISEGDEENLPIANSIADEAINALIVLGYSANDAKTAVSGVKSAENIESLIKEALKALM